MEERIKLLIKSLGEERVKLETRLNGLAQAFYIATTTRELVRAVQLCRQLQLEYLIIGTGSKMAPAGDGIRGLAIKNRSDAVKIFGIKGKVSRSGLGIEEAFLEAGSGTSLVRLADFAKAQGLGGFESLQSSLGTVGGSLKVLSILMDNAYQVKVLDDKGVTKTKQVREVARGDVILSVVFKLKARKS